MSDIMLGEPVGGEDAILWHLEQIDHHDWQADLADSCDMAESYEYHDALVKQHEARLRILETSFPETAKAARAIMQARYKAMSEANYRDASFFQSMANP